MTEEQFDVLEELIEAMILKMDRASQDCDHFALGRARKKFKSVFNMEAKGE